MIRFQAVCNKAYLDADEQPVSCGGLTFEGPAGAAEYTAHMTKVHGLSIWKNTATPAAPVMAQVPAPPKPGCLPPKGKRRDALIAAMEG
jgi:hypothetical protein